MAPQTQQPSSPTSLLWAHQMKREHSFLLTRMQKLEAAISRIEAIAIANQEKEANVTEIAKKVQTLAEEGKKKNDHATKAAIEKIREEVTDQFEELDGRLEAIINKLDSVDRAVEHVTNSGSNALEREAEMVQRVKRLDEGLKNFRENMRLLGRKVSDRSVEEIQAHVQQLVQKAKDAVDDHELVKKTVGMLEQAVEAMKEENKQLESQIHTAREEMDAKLAENAMSLRKLQAAQNAMQTAAPNNAATSRKAPTEMSTTPKDIANEAQAALGVDGDNANSFERMAQVTANTAITSEEPLDQRTGSKSKSVHGTRSRPTKALESQITAQPMKRELADLQTGTANKRRKIQSADDAGAGLSERPSRAARATRQRKPVELASNGMTTDTKTQMPIVRKGKGWVEIEEPADEGEAEDVAELAQPSTVKVSPVPKAAVDFAGNPIKVKRGRGRPRKTPAPALEETQAQPQPPKRGRGRPRKTIATPAMETLIERPESPVSANVAVDQPAHDQGLESRGTKGRVTKRKAGVIDGTAEVLAPRVTRSQRGAPAPTTAPAAAKRGRKTVTKVTIAETNARAVTPPSASQRRRGLTGVFSSPISSPPDGIDQGQDQDRVKFVADSKSSSKNPPAARRRTIPQLGSVSGLSTGIEQETTAHQSKAAFDKDFEM